MRVYLISLLLFFGCATQTNQEWQGSRFPSSSFNCRGLVENILGGTSLKDERGYLKGLKDRVPRLETRDISYLKAKLPFIMDELNQRTAYLKLLISKTGLIQSDHLWKEIYYLESLISRAPSAPKMTALLKRVNRQEPLTQTQEEVLKDVIFFLRENLAAIKIKKLGKQTPQNSQFAGGQYPMERLTRELAQKYPMGVWFDEEGFPNFFAYASIVVQTEITGAGRYDFNRAAKAAGIDRIPENMTWHHHQDGKTMMLIPKDIHDAVKHTGGVAIATASIQRVKGALPAGTEWAGKKYPLENWPAKLRIKYANGVFYKVNGHPNLNPYSKLQVEIKSTGKKQLDFRLANQEADLTRLPKGLTWYLKEDGKTMQLVPRDLLQKIPHSPLW